MDLDITVRGADRTASRFLRMHRRLGQPRPVLVGQVADYLRDREKRRFNTAGDGKWPPLSARTVQRKGNARILRDSGALMRSLTVKGAAGSKVRVSGQTLTFGTSIFYARFVTKRRPLFNVTGRDGRQVGRRVVDWLMEDFE